MLRNHFSQKCCVCLLVLGITLGLAQSLIVSASAAENPSVVDLSTAISVVSKQAIPAVAHIEVTESQVIKNPLLPFENDP